MLSSIPYFERKAQARAARRWCLVAGLAACLMHVGAQAQDWPQRPVVLINPFAAGSSVDVVGRLIAQKIAANTGQPMTVDNKTGASGNIGTDFAARAKPDGYTLLLGSPGTMAINPWLFKKLPYDAVKDFTPISVLVSFPQVVTTSAKQPFKNFPEFVAAVKAQPDKMAFSSSGQGSTSHLVMELIRADAGLKMVHLSYRGDSLATQAVLAGDVQVTVGGLPSLSPLIRAGQVRPLAVTSGKRSPLFPDLPSMAEFIPGFDATAWVLLMAPAGTPPQVVSRISAEVAKALADPQLRQQLEAQGVTPVGSNPDESAVFHRRELDKFKRAVELSGATME
jgi:tripartite-type tricarboxylate transporter receptor subunit TctC